MNEPLLRGVDAVVLPVPNLADGLRFYCDQLGHELLWRTETQAAVQLPGSVTELVLQTERPNPEVDLVVASVDIAVDRIVNAGGSVVVDAFAIPVGRLAVAVDPFGNQLVLIELSKGRYLTDRDKNVIGVEGR